VTRLEEISAKIKYMKQASALIYLAPCEIHYLISQLESAKKVIQLVKQHGEEMGIDSTGKDLLEPENDIFVQSDKWLKDHGGTHGDTSQQTKTKKT